MNNISSSRHIADICKQPWQIWICIALQGWIAIVGWSSFALSAPKKHGLIVVHVFPIVSKNGARNHLVEDVGADLTRRFKEGLEKSRYMVVEGNTLQETPGTIIIDRVVTIRSFYRAYGNQSRYQITSHFESSPDEPVNITRDCEFQGKYLQCHLQQIFDFHKRRLQALAKAGNRTKSYHLDSITMNTAPNPPCQIEEAPENLLEETITRLLEMKGWAKATAKCRADYSIRIEAARSAAHLQNEVSFDKLSLEISVDDENDYGSALSGKPYRLSNASFCSFISPTIKSDGQKWLADFMKWFSKQARR